MTLSRETLFAYIDGELPPEEERYVAAEIAKDADLHAFIEEQQRLKTRLQAAFVPVMESTIPTRLENAVRDTPIPAAKTLANVSFVKRANLLWEKFARPSSSWIPAGAMAAGLALGVLLAGTFGMASDIRDQNGVLIAQGSLARILSTQLVFDQSSANTAPMRVVLSFVSRDGNFCRNFETRGAQGALSGIACRENNVWHIAALATAEPRSTNIFRQASADMPPAIRDVLNGMIVGDPLSGDAERAARNQNWRAH